MAWPRTSFGCGANILKLCVLGLEVHQRLLPDFEPSRTLVGELSLEIDVKRRRDKADSGNGEIWGPCRG